MHTPIIMLAIIIEIAIIIADLLSIISPLTNFSIYINIFIMYFPFFQNLKTIFNYYTISFNFYLFQDIRLTRQWSLFGRIVFLRWIRFFNSSCFAKARICCENQKNRDSSLFFLSLKGPIEGDNRSINLYKLKQHSP